MKIFGYNISKQSPPVQKTANRITHEDVKDKSKKKARKAMAKIKRQTLTRQRIEITRWKNARVYAESQINPNNTELIRVFRDIEIDAHLWALMQTIRLKVMANAFNLYNDSDEIDDEATEKFRRKWFRNIIKHTVDSEFYGFSLVQLCDIVGGCFTDAELVPREYVIQQKHGVKKSLGNSKDLIPFNKGEFRNWLVPIGECDNLGLLDKAAPLVIKKKEVISAWSEAAELFGIPFRWIKTNIQEDAKKENAEDMLENMGEAGWGVFGHEDEFGITDANKSDFSNMYDKFIERVNSELSKLILLQTGTTDEKTHVGSANVMENVLKDVIEAYIIKVEDVTNEIIIPLGIRHGIFKIGTYIKADNEQKVTPKEHFDMVKELLKSYKIPEEWINETFDVPVEEKETPDPLQQEIDTLKDPDAEPTSVMKAVNKLYEGYLKSCC